MSWFKGRKLDDEKPFATAVSDEAVVDKPAIDEPVTTNPVTDKPKTS
jgi:hypothetical protein